MLTGFSTDEGGTNEELGERGKAAVREYQNPTHSISAEHSHLVGGEWHLVVPPG